MSYYNKGESIYLHLHKLMK